MTNDLTLRHIYTKTTERKDTSSKPICSLSVYNEETPGLGIFFEILSGFPVAVNRSCLRLLSRNFDLSFLDSFNIGSSLSQAISNRLYLERSNLLTLTFLFQMVNFPLYFLLLMIHMVNP